MGYPSDFSKLAVNHNGANQPNGVIREPGFRRFSVTFVDNHDTYQRDNGQELNSYYAEAANAFILCHPVRLVYSCLTGRIIKLPSNAS